MSIDNFQFKSGDKPEGGEDQAEQETHLSKLDSINPTGDPVADFRTFDEITNNGRLSESTTNPQMALRRMVVARQDAQEELKDQGDDASYLQLMGKTAETLTRLLEAYGVTAQSHDEFDDQWERREGSDSMMAKHGLETFKPTGNVAEDLAVFIAITRNFEAAQELAQNITPEGVIKNVRLRNEEIIQRGVQPQFVAAARFGVEVLAPLEIEVLDRIIAQSQAIG
jgi:hypothetical protein